MIMITGSVMLGHVAGDEMEFLFRSINSEDIVTPEECINLTMKETAYCLNDYVIGIYKYKVREDIEKPTLEELKEEGGDCKNWAELYMKHIDNLGFNSERPVIITSDKSRHTFAVISDSSGYCILDQRNVRCVKLQDSSLENEDKSI